MMSLGLPLGAARLLSAGGIPALRSNTHHDLMWGCNSGRGFTKVSFIFVGFQLNLFQLLRPRQKVAP